MGTKKVITLIMSIIIIIAIAIVLIIIGKTAIDKTTLQDLRTNMLLIQGVAKTHTEDVSVGTANLDKEKAEDSNKIEEVKNQKLKGTALENCNEDLKKLAKDAGIEDFTNYYYLSEQDLLDMGIQIKVKEDEYYLVKYDFKDTEVIYTKGYEYKNKTYYKLSELKNIEN